MTRLWPQIPALVAESLYFCLPPDGFDRGDVSHPAQVYTPVGADRVAAADIEAFRTAIEALAAEHGYPAERQPAGTRTAFDRAAAAVVHRLLDLSWSEAGQRGIWSFVALVVLPHVTHWRFGTNNPERWIATDLTRHTWARLWWQAVVFESDPQLLAVLTESDLNQLLERRTLGGDTRITCALARAVVERTPDGGTMRRHLIRDATARVRRRLEFIDTAAVDNDDLTTMCRSEVEASWEHGSH